MKGVFILSAFYPQRIEYFAKEGRERTFDRNPVAGGGGLKAQPVRVQQKARELGQSYDPSRRPIQTIADDGMMQARKMYADLMRAPGADADGEQTELSEFFEHAKFSNCGASDAQPGGHAGTALRVSRDGVGDAARCLLHASVNQGEVVFLNNSSLKLSCQRLMRAVTPSDHQDAACVAVQAMHNSRAELAVKRGQRAKAMQQRIHDSAAVVPGSGVDHHAGGFIDGDDVGIFIKNGERKCFGLGA